jgi:hypothetical protein
MATECCRQVATGGPQQPCGADNSCSDGLACLPATPMMPCQYQRATCCQPAG